MKKDNDMKRLILFLALAVSAWTFAANENTGTTATSHFTYTVYGDVPDVKPTFAEEHPLGTVVTAKWNTFLANYTRTYDVEVGMADQGTELRKPAVFKAVERANRYIKRAVKNGEMSAEDAVEKMTHILDCANIICFEDHTEDFEAAARHAKTGEDVVALFEHVELLKN